MQRNVCWKGLDADTIENCAVSYTADGIIARSEISGWADKQPVTVEYVVKLDPEWRVLEFQLTSQAGNSPTQCFAMQREATGNWKGLSGIEYPEYYGCSYIDITLTPLTNSLPINGQEFKKGDPIEIDVVYIDVMENEVRRDTQRYTKLEENKFRFENDNGNFTADIEVDPDGFVVDYPELFKVI